jgi:hypothetical protein
MASMRYLPSALSSSTQEIEGIIPPQHALTRLIRIVGTEGAQIADFVVGQARKRRLACKAMAQYVKTLQPEGNANSFKTVWVYRKRKRILEVHGS